MTFVGKVLVVVQVALSLCFMALAGAVYTVQTNWKAETEKLQTTIANRDTEYGDLEQKFEDFKSTQAIALKEAEDDRDRQQAQVATLQQRLASSEAALQAANAELKSSGAQLQLAEAEAKARIEQFNVQYRVNQELRQQLEQYRQSLQVSRDNAFKLSTDLEKSQAIVAILQGRFAELLAKFRSLGVDPQSVQVAEEGGTPPDVNGLVLVTRKSERGDSEYVEISIGRDDGLNVGNELLVYRLDDGGKYLGKIKLVLVQPDNAVGTVVEKAKNGIIQRGDHVATKL